MENPQLLRSRIQFKNSQNLCELRAGSAHREIMLLESGFSLLTRRNLSSLGGLFFLSFSIRHISREKKKNLEYLEIGTKASCFWILVPGVRQEKELWCLRKKRSCSLPCYASFGVHQGVVFWERVWPRRDFFFRFSDSWTATCVSFFLYVFSLWYEKKKSLCNQLPNFLSFNSALEPQRVLLILFKPLFHLSVSNSLPCVCS